MKTKKEPNLQVVRNKYTAQFKEQALERADRDGIPKVAQDLGLAEAMLYAWRTKRRQTGGSPLKTKSSSKPNWLASNGKTPAWKTRWPS
jgi:transposase-like protein